MNFTRLTILCLTLLGACAAAGQASSAQPIKQLDAHQKPEFLFTVTMESPADQKFHVTLRCSGLEATTIDLQMPAWMPGYYQLLDYEKALSDFQATDNKGHALSWVKTTNATWRVEHPAGSFITVSYDILAKKAFVAQPWLDSTHAYIAPTGVFLYIAGQLHQPVTVVIKPWQGWSHIATGLPAVAGRAQTYRAPNFDILYDCPILVGPLEDLPSFKVKGVPHYFTGFHMGEFDKQQLSDDLNKIVTQAVAVIGDIPYKDYTFLAIGDGPGGIEHLNSTTIGFSGASMKTAEGRQRMHCFIAHEYFHHYNVKRIRPIALGPFDYQKANKTDQLWVSEGLTVYYEYMLVRRAGLMTGDDLLHHFQSDIASYERHSGRLYQSLAQASEDTWSEGPFGGNPDSSISYYQKGPVVGLMLDFAIRHHTANKKSLDDVMRTMYQQYYQQKKRGFTGPEFRKVCETVAGTDLSEIFEYVYTTKEPDYGKYFGYGGLGIDMQSTADGKPGFRLYLLEQADPLQASIRKDWLKE
jgi:predicted metalloprotease with PDZ domain